MLKQLTPKFAYKIFTIICFIGALLSVYLLVHHLQHRLGLSNGKSFCSINHYFDCDKVVDSPYSELLGIPVASFGLFFFSVSLVLLQALRPSAEEPLTWSFLKFLSLIGIIPTIILASISVILVKSICIFCFATYLCAVSLGTISFRLELSKGNFILDGARLLLQLIGEKKTLLLVFLFFGVVYFFVPLIVLDYYRQTESTLEVSSDNKVVEEWLATKVSPESQIIVSDGPERDLSFGSDSGAVVVVSYSDVACPRCKFMASELHRLNELYPFKLIFKDYPLDHHCNPIITRSFHDSSCQAAKISRCALLTSKELYAEVHNRLYTLEVVSDESLRPIAGVVRNSSIAASECINQEGYPKSILRHLQEGRDLNIPGTPAIYVNGKFVPLATPIILEKIIKLAAQQSP